MADIAWSDVESFAADLSAVDADAQTDILAWVNDALVVADFGGETGPKLRLARIYLAAHSGTIVLRGGSGAAGPVVSESAGPLSRTYAAGVVSASDSLLDTTSWGKMFSLLVRTSPARAPIVI